TIKNWKRYYMKPEKMLRPVFLALVALAAIVAAVEGQSTPPSAIGSPVMAYAKLTRSPGVKTSGGTGTATLTLPRPDKGNATLTVSLSGSMKNVTMVHLYSKNSTANPILYDVLPRTTSGKPVSLDPPVSFTGGFYFSVPITLDHIQMWSKDMNWLGFLYQLQLGEMYIKVRTVANPGGEIRGQLQCASNPCAWPMCGVTPTTHC
ncbi:hypothetical protein Agub_g4023, partial [Astrephomene gubernaculifera]